MTELRLRGVARDGRGPARPVDRTRSTSPSRWPTSWVVTAVSIRAGESTDPAGLVDPVGEDRGDVGTDRDAEDACRLGEAATQEQDAEHRPLARLRRAGASASARMSAAVQSAAPPGGSPVGGHLLATDVGEDLRTSASTCRRAGSAPAWDCDVEGDLVRLGGTQVRTRRRHRRHQGPARVRRSWSTRPAARGSTVGAAGACRGRPRRPRPPSEPGLVSAASAGATPLTFAGAPAGVRRTHRGGSPPRRPATPIVREHERQARSTTSSSPLDRRRTDRLMPVAATTGRAAEELGAALGLVGLADAVGLATQAVEGPEEAGVLGMGPPDVARPPPTVGPESVEAPVIADPERGIGLDVVAGQLPEPGPGQPGIGDGRPTTSATAVPPRVAAQRLGPFQTRGGVVGFGVEDGLGGADWQTGSRAATWPQPTAVPCPDPAGRRRYAPSVGTILAAAPFEDFARENSPDPRRCRLRRPRPARRPPHRAEHDPADPARHAPADLAVRGRRARQHHASAPRPASASSPDSTPASPTATPSCPTSAVDAQLLTPPADRRPDEVGEVGPGWVRCTPCPAPSTVYQTAVRGAVGQEPRPIERGGRRLRCRGRR